MNQNAYLFSAVCKHCRESYFICENPCRYFFENVVSLTELGAIIVFHVLEGGSRILEASSNKTSKSRLTTFFHHAQ